MIANRRVKGHALVEKRAIRLFELGVEVIGSVRRVNVVTQHHHEIEGELLMPGDHLTGHVELGLIAPAGISNDGKPDGPGTDGKSELARRR